jgi:hypothetical protein
MDQMHRPSDRRAAPFAERMPRAPAGLAIGRPDRAPARRALDRNEEGKVRRDRRQEAAGPVDVCGGA